jgi:hypothetical protein
MNDNTLSDGWVDNTLYNNNRSQFPREVELTHMGKHVAFSLDGTRLLASADDVFELVNILAQSGIGPGQFAHEFIEDSNIGILG